MPEHLVAQCEKQLVGEPEGIQDISDLRFTQTIPPSTHCENATYDDDEVGLYTSTGVGVLLV